ncbi:PREDICTED: glutamic acid-rich protein-like isoform X2 [Lupinus angustifolius]|uniref:glutamic acid-rich protein-like isoform X2 n=1 Tax=Lupinus angustifolius TaxID=3871 RepID=UPI00092F3655|nr:PREDICTED: glutamic acid-rich protein-like isoform X2 [Lupinus angustifolius]
MREMAYNKGLHSSSGGNQRGRPFVLILLIIFGAALLGVMVLHKLRERRIYNLIVKDKDRQLLALQLLIQKERDRTKELRRKNEEMKGKIYNLRSQKMELDSKVLEMQSTMDLLKDEQKVMESTFEETQNELRIMQQKGIGLGGSETIALRESLKQKEAEIKDLKEHLQTPFKSNSVSIINGSANFSATVAAKDRTENENRETDEHSGDSNEDAGESKSTIFEDRGVTIEVKDEIRNDENQGTKNEDPQDDGDALNTAKDSKAEVVDGREMKVIKEEQPRQLKGNADGGTHDFNVKQSEEKSGTATGVKRKHGHVSRTKEKRWRTVVKNSLVEQNGISENHKEVNKGNIKVHKDELKDRTMGKVSNEENVIRKDKESDNSNQKQDEEQVKLLKPENHEEKREDAMNMIVNNTNHYVTNNGTTIQPEKERLDEIRGSGEQEVSVVQQNWSRRHIKRAEKNAGETKSNMFQEQPKETNVSDVEKQKKDDIDDGEDNEDKDDDFPRESQSEFEDDKEEYKEELDESEFHSGL